MSGGGAWNRGWFDPPVGRQSSVVIVSRRLAVDYGRNEYRIVTTLSTRSSTEVLQVDPADGGLKLAQDHSFSDEVSLFLHWG
jgi:hypothetical protein